MTTLLWIVGLVVGLVGLAWAAGFRVSARLYGKDEVCSFCEQPKRAHAEDCPIRLDQPPSSHK